MPSKLATELLAKAFRFADQAGAEELTDSEDNILGYKPYVFRAIDGGLSREYLNRIYVEELENQRFDTEKEAREYARNFLFALRAKADGKDEEK